MANTINASSCRETLRQIEQAYAEVTSAGGPGVGQLIEQFREETGLTVAQFSEQLGINTATYSRWIKNTPAYPPSLRLKLRSFLSRSQVDGAVPFANQSALVDGARINLLGYADILERHQASREIWVWKHLMPLKAGIEGLTRQMMADAMQNRDATFHFVFLGDPKSQSALSHPAQHSFVEFKKAMTEYARDAQWPSNLHGYMITSEAEAFKVGIPSGFVGLVLDIYDEHRRSESNVLVHRTYDFFVEVAAMTYDVQDASRLVGEEVRCWIEQPPKRSLALFRRFRRVRQQIEQHEILKGRPSTFPEAPDDIDLIY